MKKILLFITAFLFFVFPVSAQFDDIQKDEVKVDQFVNDETSSFSEITGENIKSFDSVIKINKDGTIDVKETIVYDFDNLQKHGIYREIPFIKTNEDGKKYELKFRNFSVTDENSNNNKFTTSYVDEKIIKLKIGDADRLITGIHNYIISYKVSGALTYFSDHDELYWNVNGDQWTVPIRYTTSEVEFPPGIKKEDIKSICYTGVFGSKESFCQVLPYLNDRTKIVIKSNKSLNSGEGLSIVVSFPKNIVAVLEPKEFVSFWDSFIGKLVMGLMGLIGLIWYIFLPFYIIYRWLKYGRDPSTPLRQAQGRSGQVPGIVSAWFDPPKTQDKKRFLTPGEVGTLGDETVDMKDISATIVDLARRGYLIIDERKKGDFYLIKNKEDLSKNLLPYEITLISMFFKTKNEIRFKNEHLYEEVEKVKNSLYS